jgi:hypothetical protein
MTGVSTFTSYNSSQRTFTLNHADVYELQSIVDATGTITPNFTLVSGQSDYFYNNSSIVLKSSNSPIGQITVTYKYFAHSAGDFFTVDSYTSNPGHENFILNYKTSTSDVVDLRNYLDFRSTQSGMSYTNNDMILNGEWFKTPLQFYMGRYDLLVVTKDGTTRIIQGVPAESPTIPLAPIDSLALEHYYIPPYTKKITDIKYVRYQVARYTMADITRLANRVQRIEEYSTLNATESELVSYDVLDASTGLSRFKTGFLAESFNQPLTIADTSSTQFRSTFDNGVLAPSLDTMICPATVQNLSNNTVIIKNSVAMLPYVEKVFAQQTVSSRITNLNPFMIVSWDGTLTVTPSSDSWIETLDLPTIFNETTETVFVTVWVSAPPPPPPPPPPPAPPPAPLPAPVSTEPPQWGPSLADWQTVWETLFPPVILIPEPTFVPEPPPPPPPVQQPAPPIVVLPVNTGGSRNGNLSSMGRESGGFSGSGISNGGGLGLGGFGSTSGTGFGSSGFGGSFGGNIGGSTSGSGDA